MIFDLKIDWLRRGAEVASYEGLVTKFYICDALEQVSLNKSPGQEGLSYEVYLRLMHMLLLILMDMFNH